MGRRKWSVYRYEIHVLIALCMLPNQTTPTRYNDVFLDATENHKFKA